jgi:hypothetical protein
LNRQAEARLVAAECGNQPCKTKRTMTNQLFEAALVIKAPWYVQRVDFDSAKR